MVADGLDMEDGRHVFITLANGFVAVGSRTDAVHLDVQYPEDNMPNGCVSARSASCLMPLLGSESMYTLSALSPWRDFASSCRGSGGRGVLRLQPTAEAYRSTLRSNSIHAWDEVQRCMDVWSEGLMFGSGRGLPVRVRVDLCDSTPEVTQFADPAPDSSQLQSAR